MSDDLPTTAEEAAALLQQLRAAAGTVFRALDLDGDGVLTAADIDDAPRRLRTLDQNGDGRLTEDELGGPTWLPGWVRQSAIVRVLDADGDLVITEADIADAPARLRTLDRDGDGRLTEHDDLPPSSPARLAYWGGTPWSSRATTNESGSSPQTARPCSITASADQVGSIGSCRTPKTIGPFPARHSR